MLSINNAEDYSSILKDIETNIDLVTPELSDRMKTEEFNTFFLEVQKSLETLYQKTRYIQDINEYIKDKILIAGNECSDYINSIETNINNSIDSYFDKSYTLKNIEIKDIQSSSKLLTDRDGQNIPTCVYQNNKIIMPASIIRKASISSIMTSATKECYSNNSNELLKKPYRSIYKIQSETELSGVTETITLVFDEEINCNYINLNVTNCSIQKIYAISSDNIQTEISVNNDYIDTTKIKSLKIILFCDNYSTKIETNSVLNNTDFKKSVNDKVDTVKEIQNELNNINVNSYADKIEDVVENYIKTANDIENRNKNSKKINDIMHTDILENNNLEIESIISEDNTTNYIYTFGIDSLEIEERSIYNTAAAIFPVDITNCDKIEIEADVNSDTGIEIYVVDSNNVTPILNTLKDGQIKDEKIFYNKSTLFTIDTDDNNNSTVIKKNGVVENISLSTANNRCDINEKDSYSISYVAQKQDIAVNKMSAIKMIMRYNTSINNKVPSIARLAVRQYGGDTKWIL